ncbi:2-polyprenyl-6-methoxyphenol hydroxylase-like FAD-dependent oxidoreductase [Filimonas zeae]|uniref:Flavin-dependent monooxygenase n=1 Tax=Filimonas zeae TaxID=1737353 RepID=A0A917ITN9_9BACT|nr:NAD(P)/FAD-dependent oxidoreductase [Filimonas zeae]MDR6339531.1 2-polyprenyl-6-methoxyphenol hydroxylase-like FAD-dependent oxidoreductase [Filimonas zeae]GGH63189.1 tetracycline resistance protein [Filimonas zeae]
MQLQNTQVAIVGGGPGGLVLAKLLQLQGVRVKVYERDAHAGVRQQGATLDLHEESGLKALAASGLTSEFYRLYRPGAEKVRVTDENGVIHYDEHTHARPDTASHHRPEIDRGPLRDLLIQSLSPGTIVWNSQFIAMQPQQQGWLLRFKNGTEAHADLVIGADGANSRIRPYVTDIAPLYSGITVVEGNVYHGEKNAPHLHALLKGGKLFALGHGKTLILSSKGDGSISFYTGTREAEDWANTCGINFSNQQQVLEWFRQRFSDWSDSWQELFASNEAYFIPRPMYHYPLQQSWTSRPAVTLLGDAAHRMPPYAGEGVNMAMLDALELSQSLADARFTDIAAAIAHYEKHMLERASEVTRITLESTEMLHSASGLQALLQLWA